VHQLIHATSLDVTVAAPPSGSSDLVTTPRFVGYYRDLKINGAILRLVHSIDGVHK
jgi:hypothetical protein